MTDGLAEGQQGHLGHIMPRRYEPTPATRSHISKPPARSVPASGPHPIGSAFIAGADLRGARSAVVRYRANRTGTGGSAVGGPDGRFALAACLAPAAGHVGAGGQGLGSTGSSANARAVACPLTCALGQAVDAGLNIFTKASDQGPRFFRLQKLLRRRPGPHLGGIPPARMNAS